MQARLSTPHLVLALLMHAWLLGSAAPLWAQRGGKAGSEPATPIWFEDELDLARKEASERNTPLIILAAKEGEEENDRFRDQALAEKTLPKVAPRAVLLIANDGEHAQRTIQEQDADGNPRSRSVCAIYGTSNCDGHRRNWDRIYLEYGAQGSSDGSWKLPEGLVLRPDGSLFERHNSGNPPSVATVLASFEKAAKEAGPGISREVLAQVKTDLATGERAFQTERWSEAWLAYANVLTLAPASRWAERASAEAELVRQALQQRLDAILPMLNPEGILTGYPQLVRFAKDCSATPLEKDARAALTRVERDKELKPVVQRLKLEIEAEDLWLEYEALVKAGEVGKARALLKKLSADKYAETPAGKRAREKSGSG